LVELDHGPYDTLREQIDAGRPGPAEFARGLTPQCFGGNFVASTVSFTKGCFTGQELVGRLDARGSSVPWRMVHVTGPNEARVNEVLTSKGPAGPSGLTTSTRRGESVNGLGFAHRSLLGSEELQLAFDVHVEEMA
jgi:folate-binding protein YgfZ